MDSFDNLAGLIIPATKPDMNAATNLDVATMLGRKPKKNDEFVKMTFTWIDKIGSPKHTTTLSMALFLLHQNWKHPGEEITVSNIALKRFHVTRKQKPEVLAELEDSGLIKVRHDGNKAPRVMILVQ